MAFARSHGVSPAAFRVIGSAPASNKASIASPAWGSSSPMCFMCLRLSGKAQWTYLAARCRGVSPFSSRAATLAPAVTRALTAADPPALCRGVLPLLLRAVTLAPAVTRTPSVRVRHSSSPSRIEVCLFQTTKQLFSPCGPKSGRGTAVAIRSNLLIVCYHGVKGVDGLHTMRQPELPRWLAKPEWTWRRARRYDSYRQRSEASDMGREGAAR